MTIKQVVQLDFDQRLVIDVGLLLGGLVGYLVLKRIERRVAPKGWLKDTSFDTFN